jgi:hypothetical protein
MEHGNEGSRVVDHWVPPFVSASPRSGDDWRTNQIVLIHNHRVLCVFPDRSDWQRAAH